MKSIIVAQSVVLYGPKGCGKTTNAARIAKALNLRRVVELDEVRNCPKRQRALPEFGVLLITNCLHSVHVDFRRLSYDHAMAAVAMAEGNKKGGA